MILNYLYVKKQQEGPSQHIKMLKNLLVAGALPRTPLGELTALLRPPI